MEDVSASDEDLENDFEETERPSNNVPLQQVSSIPVPSRKEPNFNAMRDRAGSMATVRLHRRARLAEKLKEVYDLDDIREVWAGLSSVSHVNVNQRLILYQTEMPCWLLRSVREYPAVIDIL